MKTTLATVIAGAAVVNGIFQNHDVCRDTLEEHSLCTEGGVCDCAQLTAQNPCGQEVAPITRTLEPDFTNRCPRNQIVNDIVRIAAREGDDMIGKCWLLKEAIEETGEPPRDNKVNCACLALIPEDEMVGALNCRVTDKFHGWHAYNLCQSIVLGRRRAEWDEETERLVELSIEDVHDVVQSDPELMANFRSLEQRRRMSSWAKTTTWKNVLTSGVNHHSTMLPNGDMIEAFQSGVCNATCGACGDSMPAPLTDLAAVVNDVTDLDNRVGNAADMPTMHVEKVEGQLNKFGYTDADWMNLTQKERNAIRKKANKNRGMHRGFEAQAPVRRRSDEIDNCILFRKAKTCETLGQVAPLNCVWKFNSFCRKADE